MFVNRNLHQYQGANTGAACQPALLELFVVQYARVDTQVGLLTTLFAPLLSVRFFLTSPVLQNHTRRISVSPGLNEVMMTNSRACGRARVVRRGARRIIAMLCTVCSTLVTVKATLDDPINVKVVIFRNFFARCYRNMRGTHFLIKFLSKKVRGGRKKVQGGPLYRLHTRGNTMRVIRVTHIHFVRESWHSNTARLASC